MNSHSTTDVSPEALVQQQLDAYNAHDLEALLATYAEDARLFEHPATLLASGAAQLQRRFALRFQEPNLQAQLSKRIVMDRFVVDHERSQKAPARLNSLPFTRSLMAESSMPGFSPVPRRSIYHERS